MQRLHGFITTAILALILPTALATFSANATSAINSTSTKSIPDCAASPTVLNTLPYEFWVEVVFAKPFAFEAENRPNNPLRVERGTMPFSGALFDALVIAGKDQAREFFLLRALGKALLDSNGDPAQIWPDPLSTYTYDGFNPVVFQASGDFDGYPYLLDVEVVKVCTPNFDTELQLRGQRRFFDDSGVLSSDRGVFSRPFPPCVSKEKGGENKRKDHGFILCGENRVRETETRKELRFSDLETTANLGFVI